MTPTGSAARAARVDEIPMNITLRRVAACAIAVVAWSGLALDVWVIVRHDGMSPTTAIWSELRYFTVITNLLAAAIFTSAALSERPLLARVSGSVAVPMLMVALIYWSVLYPQDPPPSEKTVVNLLLHLFTPTLVVAYHLLAHRLAPRDLFARGRTDFGELVHRYAIQQSSSALARPLSMASPASSMPSPIVAASFATTSAAAALSTTASR